MPEPLIDLRSDTLTKPTPGMRAAMAAAEVGDDVWHEDPTVNRLEERVARLLGKEACVFVPSGTMSNQIGIRAHCQPGDEMICDTSCHVHNYEAGGPAVLSGVTTKTVDGDYGILDVTQLEGKVRPINEHMTRTRLVCLENTHNRGGGKVYPLEKVQAISAWARQNGLLMHLDGARLWNAVVATGVPAATWAAEFDSVSVCFSKGLGAPVGSALSGPKDFIDRARRSRKLLGGSMRQAGVLAAAVMYALDNNVERLAEDHDNARVIASAVADVPGLRLSPPEIDTNIVWFDVDRALGTAKDVADAVRKRGVVIYPSGPQVCRMCTHLDVSREQAARAAEAIRAAVPAMRRAVRA